YIWTEYLKSNPQIEPVEERVRSSWKIYAAKILPNEALERYDMKDDLATFVDKNATPDAKKDEKFTMHVNALNSARGAILERNPETYFSKVRDVYLPILDKEVTLEYTCLTSSKVQTLLNCLSLSNSPAFGRTITIMTCLSSTSSSLRKSSAFPMLSRKLSPSLRR